MDQISISQQKQLRRQVMVCMSLNLMDKDIILPIPIFNLKLAILKVYQSVHPHLKSPKNNSSRVIMINFKAKNYTLKIVT